MSQYQPTAIINAAAYTAVDKAEQEVEQAKYLNDEVVANLVAYCESHKVHLVHVSTDYVFAGDKGSPYLPTDDLEPLGIYGQTKASGERHVAKLANQGCIIRTSWVYSEHGNNFVKSMLSLMSKRDNLGIVSDQIGSPTWARDLAKACLEAATNHYTGIYHWTDLGVASWYDFAYAVFEIGSELGLLNNEISLSAIRTEDYPTPAARPKYSVLDKYDTQNKFKQTQMHHWRKQLIRMLTELKENSSDAGK
ncbi:dTDP-4-dehydrorhamnose reductase [Pseudoalteromonas sp. SW0106-04]|nr:dTDP-4-dehydrorhamnose reductase [Pseudoalteromonas sp. SW0106-04]